MNDNSFATCFARRLFRSSHVALLIPRSFIAPPFAVIAFSLQFQYDSTLSTYRATMVPKEEHISTISRLEEEWKRVIVAVREEGEERARHGREVELTRVRAVGESAR